MRAVQIVVRLSLAAALALAVSACGRKSASPELVASGDTLLAQGKVRESIIEYRKAVEEDQQSAVAHHKLAKAYARAGSRQRALAEFARAADLAPTDVEFQLDAARELLAAGQFEDALTRATKALDIDAKNADAQVLRGFAMAGQRDYDTAITTVEDAVTLAPDKPVTYLNLGSLQASVGHRQEAEAAFKHAIQLNPKSGVAHLALGNFYWTTGRLDEAEHALAKAAELGPNDVMPHQMLAVFYLRTGKGPQAEAPLKKVAALSKSLALQIALADYYTAQQRPSDAKVVLQPLVQKKESYMAASARIAGIEYVQGNRDAAHQRIDKLLTEQPRNADVMVVKAGWLLLENKTDEAYTRAQAAAKIDPQSVRAHMLVGSIEQSRSNHTEAVKEYTEVLRLAPQSIEAQLALANLHLKLGKADAAVTFAEQAVQNQPQNGLAHLALAQALIGARKIDQARREATLLVNGAPSIAAGHVVMGQIQYRTQEWAAASKSFERALELDPTSVEALTGIVGIDVRNKNLAQAHRRVAFQLAKTPNNPRLLVLQARTHVAGGDRAAAESALKAAIVAEPSYLDAYRLLGQLYVGQNRLDDARKEYERIVKQRPQNVAAQTMVAMILQVQNKHDEAKVVYQRVLELDPRAAVASNNLAYMAAEANTNLDIALQWAQTAKSQLPDDPDVSDTLGWVYVRKGLGRLGVPHLEQSVYKDPRNPLYQFHLGLAYLDAGERTKAKSALEQALRLNENFEGATEAKKALATLKG